MKTKIKAFGTLADGYLSSSEIMILPQINFTIWDNDKDYCISFGWIIFMVEFWF